MLIFCVVNSERRRYEQCNQRDLEGENFECERLVDKDNLFRSFKLPPSSLDMTIPQYFRVCFFFFFPSPPHEAGNPQVSTCWEQRYLCWAFSAACPDLWTSPAQLWSILQPYCSSPFLAGNTAATAIKEGNAVVSWPLFSFAFPNFKNWILLMKYGFIFFFFAQPALLLAKSDISTSPCSGFFVN